MKQSGTFNYFGKWKADEGSDSIKEFAKNNIGKKLILTIEEPKKDRSLNQNSYMWGVVYEYVSQFTGYTPEEVHDTCKAEFNYEMVEILNKETGELIQEKKVLSTKNLSTDKMEIYLERIRRYYLTKYGLMIPLPNEIL